MKNISFRFPTSIRDIKVLWKEYTSKHLITRPFNLKQFQETFPDVDVHKNSMGTLLYFPNNIKLN